MTVMMKRIMETAEAIANRNYPREVPHDRELFTKLSQVESERLTERCRILVAHICV